MKEKHSLFDKVQSHDGIRDTYDDIDRERIIDWLLGLPNEQLLKVILDTINDIDSDHPLGDHGFRVQITLEEALRKKLGERRVHEPEDEAKDFIEEQRNVVKRVEKLEQQMKELKNE